MCLQDVMQGPFHATSEQRSVQVASALHSCKDSIQVVGVVAAYDAVPGNFDSPASVLQQIFLELANCESLLALHWVASS